MFQTPLIIFTLIIVIVSFLLFMLWKIHKEMTTENTEQWGYGNFKQFMSEFNKVKWERKSRFPESFFGEGESHDHNKIHASIIKFDGKGMVLTPWSYLKFKMFIKKNKLKISTNKNKKLWKK